MSSQDQRKAQRRDILDQFSFYICVPKLGFARHKVNDISELGIGFTLDTLGEFRLKNQEQCDLHFYVNQSLYVPLKIEVVRQSEMKDAQSVGAIFLDTGTKEFKTFLSLVKLIDQLSEIGITPP